MSPPLKGFGDFDEPDEPRPRPGTYAHLRAVAKEKERERQSKPVDNSEAPPSPTTPKSGGPPESGALPTTTPESGGPPESEGAPESGGPPESGAHILEAGEVRIEKNYTRLDNDIFDLMPTMSGAELKIYLALIKRTYGQIPPRNICSVTNALIARDTGLSSHTTLAKTLQALESRRLIQRLIVAHKPGEQSLYRVSLPSEFPGAKSRTVVSFKK